MDLLPGPVEDAAVERVRPLLDADFGLDHWAVRLRTGATVPETPLADASAAGLFTASSVTAEAQIAVELGRTLAPIELVAAMLASTGDARVAIAALRPRGGVALFGPLAADVVLVWHATGIGIAGSVSVLEVVDCIDPTTPMAYAEVTAVQPASDEFVWRARLLVAAVHAGLARGARDMAVEYARARVQFDRPIGANQAVKHLCADAATRTEAAWAALLYASASLAEQREDARFQIAVAARIAGDAANRNARTNIQVHGGRGYTLECPAHLFLMRAQVLEQVTGGARQARRAILQYEPLA